MPSASPLPSLPALLPACGHHGAQVKPWPHATPSSPATSRSARTDLDATAMIRAYSATGGVASGDTIASLLRPHTDQPISRIARWIVAGHVVSFVWRSETLLPLFQFDLASMSVRPGTLSVITELSGALDNWELARWFAQPNACLAGAAPADTIAADLSAVLRAARTDRLVINGV